MTGGARIAAAILLAGAALCGCARLTVQVDVMDPVYAKQATRDAEMRIEGQRLAEGNYRTTRALVAKQFAIYRDFRKSCLTDAAKATEARAAASAGADRIQHDANAKIYRDFIGNPQELARIGAAEQAWLIQLLEADRGVGKAVMDSGGILPQKAPISEAVQTSWLARSEKIVELQGYLDGEVRQSYNICEPAVTPAVAQLGQTGKAIREKIDADRRTTESLIAATTQQSITGGGILLSDRLEAFYVTDAPKEAWAESYNRAFGEGIGGGTSIAVIMNDTADFSIKGFVFDGRSTADMIGKVAVQAVTLLAASQGLPVGTKPASGSDPAAFTSDATKLVADTQSRQYAAQANDAAYRAFLFRMADAILVEMDDLTKSNVSGSAARARVKAMFDARKESLGAKPK